MKQWNSIDEILQYAIGQEEEAAEFYTDLAARMDEPWMRKIFEEYAEEEREHKRKLLAIKEGNLLQSAAENVVHLKIADYLVDAEPTTSMGYREALILAMKKRKPRSSYTATLPRLVATKGSVKRSSDWPKKTPSTNTVSNWSTTRRFKARIEAGGNHERPSTIGFTVGLA